MKQPIREVAASLAALTLYAGPAAAQSTWGGSGATSATNDYKAATNWSSGVPMAAGAAAVFANTGNAAVAIGGGAVTADAWTFAANAQSYTITGSALTFAAAGLINNAAAGTISIANAISGSRDLVQAGAGTLVLTGSDQFALLTADAGLLRLSGGAVVSDTWGRIAGTTGSNGNVTVSGTGSRWNNSTDVTVGAAGIGTLTVMNGGAVSAPTAYLGTGTGSSGTLTVTGAGSQWTTTGSFFIADGGAGTVTIADGGSMTVYDSYLAYGPGSMATGAVTGVGSRWDSTGKLWVGSNGSATLTITGGAAVSDATGIIGHPAGFSSTLTVSGTGSRWDNASETYIGDNGTGRLGIASGGVATTGTAYVGYNAGANGTVTVADANTRFTTSALYAGYSGLGTVTVANGGTLTALTAYMGTGVGSHGTVNVTGAGTQWNTAGSLFIADGGSAGLTVADGGAVTVADGYLAYGSGSSATALVTGAGSRWTIGNKLWIGSNGSGTMTITAGAVVSDSYGSISNSPGYSSALTVRGSGSRWDTTNAAYIGDNGIGTLSIADGGAVSAGYAYLGYGAGGNGSATLSGAASSLTANSLYVGNLGSGTLSIANGGAVNDTQSVVAYRTGSTGAVTVTGSGSNWTSTSNMWVGYAGSGTLTVSDGGATSNVQSGIGWNSGATGFVTITGEGSRWTNTSNLYAGYNGGGTLTIADGGTVANVSAVLGYATGSNGTIVATGPGSRWSSTGTVWIGRAGAGTARVADGGTIVVGGGTGTVTLAANTGSTGTLTFGAPSGSPAAAAGFFSAGTVAFGSGTGTLVLNHTGNPDGSPVSFAPVITGAGAIQLLAGVTTFLGANTYSGPTMVAGGTLRLQNGAALGSTSAGTSVSSGAALELLGGIAVGAEALSLAGTGLSGSGALRNTAGTNSFGGSITLATDARINADAGSMTLDGAIDGSGGSRTLTLGGDGNGFAAGAIAASIRVLTKDGAGTWTLSGSDTIGGTAAVNAGSLAVRGSLKSNLGVIGDGLGSDGIVSVAGANVRWNNASSLVVGNAGRGALSVTGGGSVSNTAFNLGFATGARGSVLVTGTGSTWTSTANGIVGGSGLGSLTVAAGGRVIGVDSYFGSVAGSLGAVTVTGAGSNWSGRNLTIGLSGSGSLSVTDGGNVANAASIIGGSATSTGSALVSGSGSVWSSGGLTVGNSGSGTLTVANGGAVSVGSGTGRLWVAANSGASGTLNIGAAAASAPAMAGQVSAATVAFGSGHGTLVFNHTGNPDGTAVVFSPVITGTSAVEQRAGTTILTGLNGTTGGQFTGVVTVSGGLLAVNGILGDTVGNDASVRVVAGGTLHGSGTVAGSVAVQSGGLVSAGNSPGTLTVTGDYALSNGATSLFELGTPGVVGGSSNDLIKVGGNLALGGTLRLVNAMDATAAPVAGAYRLFDYGGTLTGSFDAVTTPVIAQSTTVYTTVPGQVNVLVSNAGQSLQYWDGSDTSGSVPGYGGGTGQWRAAETAWVTSPTGSVNTAWQAGVGIFAGAAGTVNLAGRHDVQGLQFASDGYRLEGTGTISLSGDPFSAPDRSFITVDHGVSVTIANALVSTGGAFGLNKLGGGTLTMTGASTFGGQTTVNAGMLSIAGSGALASAVSVATGAVLVNAGMLGGTLDTAGTATNSGAVLGATTNRGTFANTGSIAGLLINQAGTTRNGGTLAGGAAVTGGTLMLAAGSVVRGDVGNAATVLAEGRLEGAVSNAAGASFTLTGALAGVTRFANEGTLSLAGQDLDIGTLLGSGARGVVQNDSAGPATLSVDNGTYAGLIADGAAGGTLALAKTGAGLLTLSGPNSYSGPTIIRSGTLQTGAADVLSHRSAVLVAGGATLDLAGHDQTIGALTGAGTVALGSATLTTMVTGGATFSGTATGTGSLVKGGVGTLTLSGFNSFTGPMQIAQGTLENQSTLNGDAVNAAIFMNAGTVVGAVANTGTLSNTGTIGGTVRNDGTLLTSGTLSRGLINTASATADGGRIEGDIVNQAGVLEIRGTLTSSGTLWNAVGARMLIAEAGRYTLAGTLSNAGALTVVSGGSLAAPAGVSNAGMLTIEAGATVVDALTNTGVVSNAGTYTADVVNASGALLTNTGTFSTTSQPIQNRGTLVSTGVLDGGLSNDGWAQVAGQLNGPVANRVGGLLTLTAPLKGVSNLTNDGTVDLGGTALVIGFLSGSTPMAVLRNGRLTAGSDNTSTDYAGSIQDGAGVSGLTKVGSGTLTLSGASTYSGPTTIIEGTLALRGSLTSDVTVSGGTLSGTGSVSGISVARGGVIAPGGLGTIGTLSSSGDIRFEAGSVYAADATAAGQADRIMASGAASLQGGTVEVWAGSGRYAPQTRYTLLMAAAGVTGRFAEVTSNFAFLSPILSYDATTAYLTLARNDIRFDAVAATPNQASVAAAVQAGGVGTPLYDGAALLSAPQARAAFDAVSGEIHSSAMTAQVSAASLTREAVLNRLRFGDSPAIRASANTGLGRSFWGQGFGSFGTTGGNGNAARLDQRISGFVIGADGETDAGWRIGAAGGYTGTNLAVDARRSSGTVGNVFGALYGGTGFGPLQLRAGATVADASFATRRTVGFDAFLEGERARYGGAIAQGFGEVGYCFGSEITFIEPFAAAAALRVTRDGFAETGGMAALSAAGDASDVLTSTFGLQGRARLDSALDGTMPVMVRGVFGYRHTSGDILPSGLFTISATQQSFLSAGVPISTDAFVAEGGIDWQVGPVAMLSLTQLGQFGSDSTGAYGVRGRFLVQW